MDIKATIVAVIAVIISILTGIVRKQKKTIDATREELSREQGINKLHGVRNDIQADIVAKTHDVDKHAARVEDDIRQSETTDAVDSLLDYIHQWNKDGKGDNHEK